MNTRIICVTHNIDITGKDIETKKEVCSQCHGKGFHESSHYVTYEGEYQGKRYSEPGSESEWVGCTVCGGSGSFPTLKAYSNSFFSSAQSKYDRDFNIAIKKGCGKVVVKYETFPCPKCGKYHGELSPDGYFIMKFNKRFAPSSEPLPCDGHTEIREVFRKPDNSWF